MIGKDPVRHQVIAEHIAHGPTVNTIMVVVEQPLLREMHSTPLVVDLLIRQYRFGDDFRALVPRQLRE